MRVADGGAGPPAMAAFLQRAETIVVVVAEMIEPQARGQMQHVDR